MIRLEISLFCLLLVVLFLLNTYLNRTEKYPDPKTLFSSDGMIHHPTYGDYPEKVTFEQGMTLYPGQSSYVEIAINFETGEINETP